MARIDKSSDQQTFVKKDNMKSLAVFCIVVVVVAAKPTSWQDSKRQKYALPEGAELLVGPVRSTFTCFANGYYADVDNNCQIFHVCSSADNADGSHEQRMFSFVCGNQTVFNQLTFTCTYPEDAVPCVHAQDFYYLNSHVEAADPEVHFLDDMDIQRAAPLVDPEVYGRRIEKPAPEYHQNRRRFDFDNLAHK